MCYDGVLKEGKFPCTDTNTEYKVISDTSDIVLGRDWEDITPVYHTSVSH